ncbi:glycosyl hydrolase [Moniliophthora roreri]|nr:glycosyl hydrolase [Moniliophthora roreri]
MFLLKAAGLHSLRTLATLYFLCLSVMVVSSQNSTVARVLIYSATRGFRHDSIPTAIEVLKAKGPSINVDFDNTEDENAFTDENLAGYDAVLFLSTTGEVLQAPGKAAFQNYLDLGGNFIGIHSSSDSLLNDTFFEREIGAYFDYHPPLQNATINVLDQSHPSTRMLPAQWRVQDEMYNFKSDLRAVGATVILSADESSYTAWYQERGAGVEKSGTPGRSFYTSLGHLNETWHDDLFIGHVLGGMTWTLQANTTRAFNPKASVGAEPGGGTGSVGSNPDSHDGSPQVVF